MFSEAEKGPGRPLKILKAELTETEFAAFENVARLRDGPTRALIYDVFVNATSTADAAREVDMHPSNASSAVSRARATLEKIRIAAGTLK
ncbi:hypothetical protein [Rhodoferax antarcticus]|uniref:hypothetical protein n=1 Tax=Rhodoferax antarcticus TaxID=81479 RepID=UPI001115066A|nr:hypothetical protein [Rhodoferax antarcticus]